MNHQLKLQHHVYRLTDKKKININFTGNNKIGVKYNIYTSEDLMVKRKHK